MSVAPARRQPDLLGATRKEIEKERSEMLAEIARMDSELEAAREGFRQGAEAPEAGRRADEQTRSAAREARVFADEREKRLAAQETELHDLGVFGPKRRFYALKNGAGHDENGKLQ